MTAQTTGPCVINVLKYIILALSCMLRTHVYIYNTIIGRYAGTIIIIIIIIPFDSARYCR